MGHNLVGLGPSEADNLIGFIREDFQDISEIMKHLLTVA
jgi:hypothetical protein